MNAQVFGCPSCQQQFQVLPDHAGQFVQCPACAQVVEVPRTAFNPIATARSTPPPLTSPIPQIFRCRHCQGQFGVTAEMLGTHVGCPHCRQAVLIQAEPVVPTSANVPITSEIPPVGSRSSAPKPSLENVPVIDSKTTSVKPPKRKPDKSSGFQPPEIYRHSKVRSSDLAPPTKTSDLSPPTKSNIVEATVDTSLTNKLPPTAHQSPVNQSSAEVSEIKTQATLAADSTTELQRQETVEGPPQADSIDHLLPPRFDVEDPARLRIRDQLGFKISLPDGKGGTQQIDQRILRVDHGGEKIALIALSPQQKLRRRIISNFIAIIVGIAILALAFRLLI